MGVPFPCRFLLLVLVSAFLANVALAQDLSLTIQPQGLESGTVAILPLGLVCADLTGCLFSIPSGTDLILSATSPVPGGPVGIFSDGAGSASGCVINPCSFTMTSDSSITVTYISQEEQADPEHIHQAFLNTRYLPHVVNGQFEGGNARTTFVLFNISSTQATVDLSLTRDDGTPWEVTIPAAGTNSTFRVGLDPGESKFLKTDGLGTVTTGAAIVSSDFPIGVSAIFSIFDEQGDLLTETGVGASTPLKETVIPVDVTGSFDTGIALFNQGNATVTVARRLLDQAGNVVDSAALLSLEAKEHLAQFTSDLFPGLNDFRGSVSVSSSDELAALTLRQNTTPLFLTTLPAEGSTETTGFVVQSEIGPFGGQITTVKGDRVTIPSGAFVEATNITVKTVSQENFEDLLDMDLESEGFSFVSVVDIDSNGVSFERPIQFAAEASVFTTDAQMIVVTIQPDFDGDGRPEMVFLTGGSVEASEALSEPFVLTAADGSAVIALLGPIELMGFVSGTVLDPEGTPLAARGRSTFSELRWYPPMEAVKGSLSWVFRAKQPESVRTGP